MKILIPVDGSAQSNRAARFVIRQWLQRGDLPDLTVVHVDLPLSAHIGGYLGAESVAQFHARNSELALRPVRRLLAKAGHIHEEVMCVGDPAEEIVRVATKGRHELIAMGSHGRGAVGSMFLGSVVLKVLSRSKVPVVVVR
ncbi:universal stress protein [Luteibacter sp. UNCMF366Tsu5.1]|uniref:universal stress protein n=1 Tax=Luteibacter sp. UNCMF366Tsu5.1 TaxID=1502758 RepID=UPI000908F7EE|nr:universal stress protein [Luteibacter sp. UNCMF366Tsu5.1]SFW22998.1 Nucleotide-binding universal stress protein, UspA family [Luteibacter sp. UNCMF366Tsu5.1]